MPSIQRPNSHPLQFNRILYLSSLYNHSTALLVSNRFTHGFPLHFQGNQESSHARNLLSAVKYPTMVGAKIAKELAAGHLTGPFDSPAIYPPLLFLHSMQSSLQSSSVLSYQRAWNLFPCFNCLTFPGLPLKFPISVPMFCIFIAYLYDLRYAASTVNAHVSALSCLHKLSGYPDPSKAFVIVQGPVVQKMDNLTLASS